MTTLRIYTDNPVSQSPTWSSSTVLLPMEREGRRRIRAALRNLFTTLRHVENDAVMIFGNTYPLSASLATIALRRLRPSVFLVRLDPLLLPPTLVRLRWVRAFTKPLNMLLVHTPNVAERYHAAYGIPLDKMYPIRFHHSLTGFEYEVTEGDYVFAGGDSQRDYSTLLRAVDGTGIPVVIATRKQLDDPIPENVRVQAVSPQEFRNLMAGSRFIVLPLDMTRLRTAGQQSFLSAMALGKLVIVTDTVDAPYYIEHMQTGLLTPSRDVQALREAIVWAWEHREECRRIGTRAREVALPMDQEWCYSRILQLVREEYFKNRVDLSPGGNMVNTHDSKMG